jgi:hypothetical protein
MSIRKDTETKLHLMTPEGLPVNIVYRDANEKIWTKPELGRGKEDEDGNLIPVDLTAVEEAKKSALVANVIDLNVHPREDVDDFLFPDKSNAYVFLPVIRNSSNKVIDDPVNDKWYEVLNNLVRDPKLAFIGRCNLSGHEGMFRLSIYRGHVVLQKQLFPEEVNEFEVISPKISRVEKAKVAKLAEALVKPFNPEDYPNEITQRVAEATSADFDPAKLKARIDADREVDVTSALDAALAEFV